MPSIENTTEYEIDILEVRRFNSVFAFNSEYKHGIKAWQYVLMFIFNLYFLVKLG